VTSATDAQAAGSGCAVPRERHSGSATVGERAGSVGRTDRAVSGRPGRTDTRGGDLTLRKCGGGSMDATTHRSKWRHTRPGSRFATLGSDVKRSLSFHRSADDGQELVVGPPPSGRPT